MNILDPRTAPTGGAPAAAHSSTKIWRSTGFHPVPPYSTGQPGAIRLGQPIAGDREPCLTGREVEILRHVAAGETSREIGRVLYISENTVKNHIRNILEKLHLHSRMEAVVYAVREKMIEIS